MFSIWKRFDFSASHQLTGLAPDHPCARVHGHNYCVELEFSGGLDDVGFVIDYRALDEFKRWIDETFDHRHLNDVLGDMNPTAENLAMFFYSAARKFEDTPRVIAGEHFTMPTIGLSAVRVRETEKTCAEYRP